MLIAVLKSFQLVALVMVDLLKLFDLRFQLLLTLFVATDMVLELNHLVDLCQSTDLGLQSVYLVLIL